MYHHSSFTVVVFKPETHDPVFLSPKATSAWPLFPFRFVPLV